jgi:hypothetical protein
MQLFLCINHNQASMSKGVLIRRLSVIHFLLSYLLIIEVSAQEAYAVKGLKYKEINNEAEIFDHYLETDRIVNEFIAIQILIIRDSVGCNDDIHLSSGLPELFASHLSLKDKKFLGKKKTVRLEFKYKEFYDDQEICLEMARQMISECPQLLEIELYSFSVAWMCLDGYAITALEFNDQYEFNIHTPENEE